MYVTPVKNIDGNILTPTTPAGLSFERVQPEEDCNEPCDETDLGLYMVMQYAGCVLSEPTSDVVHGCPTLNSDFQVQTEYQLLSSGGVDLGHVGDDFSVAGDVGNEGGECINTVIFP